MDIELNTLLVALMFVTILSMGIGNILVTLAGVLNNTTTSRRDRVHVSWIVLMLVIHFNLFWNTKAILAVEGWQFGGFLLTMAGPVLLFFATSILLTSPATDQLADLRTFFHQLGRRFFLMFAAVQIWVLATVFVLEGKLTGLDFVNVALFVVAMVLAMTTSARVQLIGALLAWGLGIGGFVFRWIG